jgi:hypothetical protein
MTGIFYGNTLVVARQLNWVTVLEYCRLSGETKEAVDGKRKSGLWIEGMHWIKAPDNKIRINLPEVDLWVQYNDNIPARLKPQRGYRRATQKPAIV